MSGPKRKLVAEQWDQFARAVLPKDAGETQRREMRRAFYAGAQGVMFGVIAALTPSGDAEEGDVQMLQELHDELSEFGEKVKAGRA